MKIKRGFIEIDIVPDCVELHNKWVGKSVKFKTLSGVSLGGVVSHINKNILFPNFGVVCHIGRTPVTNIDIGTIIEQKKPLNVI